MTSEAIGDLFAALGPIRTRAMFGGQGVFREDLMFALVADGEIYLKADVETASLFESAGSQPFSYRGSGRIVRTSYWRLPDAALDDPAKAEAWGRLAVDASSRARSSRRSKRA